jgi:hypothetical protein
MEGWRKGSRANTTGMAVEEKRQSRGGGEQRRDRIEERESSGETEERRERAEERQSRGEPV